MSVAAHASAPAPASRGGSADAGRIVASIAFAGVVGAFALGPVLHVVVTSFSAIGGGWSLDGWRAVAGDGEAARAIVTSLVLAVRVPIGLAIAFLAAWLLVRVEVPGRRFVEMSLWFGFFMPSVPIVTGWVLLLDRDFGLVNDLIMRLGLADRGVFDIHSMPGIVWAHITGHTIPILVILMAPAFRRIDAAMEEAAIVAGASRWMVLTRIVLPAMAPAVLVAATAALIKSLESFEIEQVLGVPSGIDVYATRVFDMVADDPPQLGGAMALSTVFLVVLVGLLALNRGTYGQRARGRTAFSDRASFRRSEQPRWVRIGGSVVLIAFVLFGIYLPFVALVMGSFMRLFGFFGLPQPWTTEHWRVVLADQQFLGSLRNTLVLGLTSGVAGALAFAAAAWVLVRSSLLWRPAIGFVVWLPWAIPGIVLGVVFLDLSLSVPLVTAVRGTMIPVVVAILIKEMPIGIQLMRVAVEQVPRSMEEVALVSGAGRLRTFTRITLPLVAPALAAVFLLVFAATVRDISTLVLIAPPNRQTLSLLMFSYAGIAHFEPAAVIGTIVALLSLVLAVAAHLFSARAGARR